MRLTLRTLLAYLDDILEPAQTKEIGNKLAESKFASDLGRAHPRSHAQAKAGGSRARRRRR